MFLPVDPSIRYFSRFRDGTSACYQDKFHAHNTFLVKVKGVGVQFTAGVHLTAQHRN